MHARLVNLIQSKDLSYFFCSAFALTLGLRNSKSVEKLSYIYNFIRFIEHLDKKYLKKKLKSWEHLHLVILVFHEQVDPPA